MNQNRPNILAYNQFYLMGIKGVAMTSLAQILIDAGKNAAGCDVSEDFVTQKQLQKLPIEIEVGFDQNLPAATDCVIYTAAHQGPSNPIVKKAQQAGIKCYSQAEALANFFNHKKGIAICGVGGKSTVSAMLAWIFEKQSMPVSYSVGVGNISGLERTGRWLEDGKWFIAEADEYVIDPQAASDKNSLTARFSFLEPDVTVCTNLEFDHPDVYQDFNHTKQIFSQFFHQLRNGGRFIYCADNQALSSLTKKIEPELKQKNITLVSYGSQDKAQAASAADMRLINYQINEQTLKAKIDWQGQSHNLELKVPGKFNVLNAMAASLAAQQAGISISDSFQALKSFQGTMRRFELVAEKDGVIYLDDYAHHPHEIKRTIEALREWYPNRRRVIAFQPHTFSRTKQLLSEFVEVLGQAEKVLLLDIFPSAREKYDPSVSSDLLVEKVKAQFPQTKIANLKSINSLADYCQHQLKAGDVLMTMGAGDIYQVHQLV